MISLHRSTGSDELPLIAKGQGLLYYKQVGGSCVEPRVHYCKFKSTYSNQLSITFISLRSLVTVNHRSIQIIRQIFIPAQVQSLTFHDFECRNLHLSRRAALSSASAVILLLVVTATVDPQTYEARPGPFLHLVLSNLCGSREGYFHP